MFVDDWVLCWVLLIIKTKKRTTHMTRFVIKWHVRVILENFGFWISQNYGLSQILLVLERYYKKYLSLGVGVFFFHQLYLRNFYWKYPHLLLHYYTGKKKHYYLRMEKTIATEKKKQTQDINDTWNMTIKWSESKYKRLMNFTEMNCIQRLTYDVCFFINISPTWFKLTRYEDWACLFYIRSKCVSLYVW